MAKEKKERKKETSAVKYNTSGHCRGRRYNYSTTDDRDGELTMASYLMILIDKSRLKRPPRRDRESRLTFLLTIFVGCDHGKRLTGGRR